MTPDASGRCDPGDDHCVTCGDVGIPMRVIALADGLAVCADDQDATQDVAVDLVSPVSLGDRVLVHAGVAIGLLGDPA